ncbi:hypothetical protein J2X31_002611 [Flavobacterium arsenatis]|jgi:hypothetical protein|uniref:Histidine kinase n=1 Tax=Flavobacterium arsenatis TaxID=1484332 RepID=A0ABU1TRU3_9FLAO|nr:hypothetical protein [Flavobacterium arsenatis]
MDDKKIKAWKKNYTLVIVANAIYILIFYFLMQYFS